MLTIKFYDVDAKFNEIENGWECNDKDTLELLEKHRKVMFENMPYDIPFKVSGVGGYIVDNLRRIYGNAVVKVDFLKSVHVLKDDKNGNSVGY